MDTCWNWSHEVYYNTGFRRKEQRPTIACTFMCRHTSLFVQELLKPTDDSWKVVQGTLAPIDGTAPQVHYWLENDRCRVDLTAEQFGWEPVLVTGLDDPRYVRNELAKPAKASIVKTTLDQWRGLASRDWMDNHPGFQAIQANQAALARFQQAWQVSERDAIDSPARVPKRTALA